MRLLRRRSFQAGWKITAPREFRRRCERSRESLAFAPKVSLNRLSRYALLLLSCLGGAGLLRGASANWQNDYSIVEGFRIQRDTIGYHMPTAIAFVPNPGPGPKDPLYFVTELRGKLKVVTNDRTVFTFADGFQQLVPHKELPDHLGEIGMAGICLEPEHGYIFVSYAYADADGLYRNAIMRFDTQPGTFAIKPTGQKRLATVLDGFLSNVAHQIGPLAVVDGCLMVTLGDALSAWERDGRPPAGLADAVARLRTACEAR